MAGRDLYGMIDFEGYEFLKPLAANYKMNLITLSDLKEDKLETGLREIVGMMKCRRDKQKMQRYVREHAERFRKMDELTYDTICAMTSYRQMEKYKKENQDGKGKVDMCKAFEDWEKDLRAEGRRDGEKIGREKGEKAGIRKGKREAILDILRELGQIPESLRQTIMSQTNLKQLTLWVKLAASCSDISEFEAKISA